MESKIIASEVEAEVCSADLQWNLGAAAFSSNRTQNALVALKSQSHKQIEEGKAETPIPDDQDSLAQLKQQLAEN